MNTFLVLACCLASLVSARPDVSLGYHYHPEYNSGSDLLTAPVASNSYAPAASGVAQSGFDNGAASSSGLSLLSPGYSANGYGSGGFASSGLVSGGLSSGYSGSSSGIGVGGLSLSGGDSGAGAIGLASGFNAGLSQGYGGGAGIGNGFGSGIGSGISSGFGSAVGGGLGQFSQQAQFEAPIITKSFYVHSAPEDHDDQQIVRYVTIGRPQKNYRVLFINAPSSTSTKAKIIANVAPIEDRTAVYVLSKKTNDLDISTDVVTPAPTGPTKPDVFFIKYKTPEEAIHAQHVIQAQYDQLGGSTNFSNEGFVPVQSVIGSLGGQGSGIAVGGGSIQGSSSRLISHGEGSGVITSGPVPSSSQIDIVGGGNIRPQTNYLPPKNKDTNCCNNKN